MWMLVSCVAINLAFVVTVYYFENVANHPKLLASLFCTYTLVFIKICIKTTAGTTVVFARCHYLFVFHCLLRFHVNVLMTRKTHLVL